MTTKSVSRDEAFKGFVEWAISEYEEAITRVFPDHKDHEECRRIGILTGNGYQGNPKEKIIFEREDA